MKCRMCRSDDLFLYYTQGNIEQYKFYKCRKCGLVNYDMSGRINQGKYAETYTDPFDAPHKFNVTQDITYDFIKKHIKSKGRLIDIGCGNGRLLLRARDDGWDVMGLELSEFLAKEITQRHGIKVTAKNFLDMDENEVPKANLVVLRHVFEHLPDAVHAITKIGNLLDNKGMALLEFPNIDALSMKLRRYLDKINIHKKKYREDYMPGHCNEYSKKSFTYLASMTGFEIVHWETYSYKPVSDFIYKLTGIGNKARVLIRKVK